MPSNTANKLPISIIEVEEEANLNQVTWNQSFLEQVRNEYKLKHLQAVLFINRAHDRFRLVACFYGLAVLILPPVDPEDRISLYLKVSKFLRQFSTHTDVLEMIADEIETAEQRIARRKSKALAAKRES